MFDDIQSMEPNEDGKIWLCADKYYFEDDYGYEYYVRKGSQYLFHREGAPAKYSKDLFEICEEYYLHGNRHREDGPAIVRHKIAPFNFPNNISISERISEYMRQGQQCHYEWYWLGRKCSFKEWLDLAGLPEKERALLLLKYK